MTRRLRSYLVPVTFAVWLAGTLWTSPAARALEAPREEPQLADPSPEPPSPPDPLAPAREAYAGLRLDEAWAEIERALVQIEADPVLPLTLRVEALVLAASIARARLDLAGSDAALDRALALDPRLSLDPALHPPPLLEALERRRAARVIVEALDPDAGGVVVVPPDGGEGTHEDPWPWVGLGAGAFLVVGGAIVLGVVLAQPPGRFDVAGTIVP